MGEMTTHTMRQLEAEANRLLIQAGNPELVHPNTNDALHPTHATTYGNATDVERAARRNPNHAWDNAAAIAHAIDGNEHTPRHYHHTPRTRITDANTMPNPPAWIYAIKTSHRHQQWLSKWLAQITSINTTAADATNSSRGFHQPVSSTDANAAGPTLGTQPAAHAAGPGSAHPTEASR